MKNVMKAYENAEKWIISDCWLASFDILGFRNLVSVDQDDLKRTVCVSTMKKPLKTWRKAAKTMKLVILTIVGSLTLFLCLHLMIQQGHTVLSNLPLNTS